MKVSEVCSQKKAALDAFNAYFQRITARRRITRFARLNTAVK